MTDPKEYSSAWVKAFNAHDEEGLRKLVADDAVFRAPGDTYAEGRDAIIEYTMGWLNAFPDATVDMEQLIVSGTWVAALYTFEGTHTEPLPGPTGEIPATGRQLSGRVADITRIEDGVAVDIRLYFDQLDVLAQLGLVPELARA